MDRFLADFIFGLVIYYPALTLALAVPYLAWVYMGVTWLDTRWAAPWIKGARLVVVLALFLLGMAAPFWFATFLGIGPTDPLPEASYLAHHRSIPMELLPFFAGLLAAAAIPGAMSRYAGVIDRLVARIEPPRRSAPAPHFDSPRNATGFEQIIDDLLRPARHQGADAVDITRMPGYSTLTSDDQHALYRRLCDTHFLVVLKRPPKRGQALSLRRLYHIPTRRMVIIAEEASRLDGLFEKMPYATIKGNELLALLSDEHKIVIRQRGLIFHLGMATVEELARASTTRP